MKLLSVSALSSWTHCPKQFYQSYVLGIRDPPNPAIMMGLLKHKLHENITKEQQKIIMQIKPEENVQLKLQSEFTKILQSTVISQTNVLRTVNIPLTDAYQKSIHIAINEAEQTTQQITPLLQKGLTGEELWHTITPKIKTEYSLESKKLGIKGRIDRLELHENQLIPVELKSGMAPQEGAWESHKIQATSYALMLEDNFNTPVPEAIIHYLDHKSRRTLTINPFLKETVTNTISAVQNCLETKQIPKGCGKENCQYCKTVGS